MDVFEGDHYRDTEQGGASDEMANINHQGKLVDFAYAVYQRRHGVEARREMMQRFLCRDQQSDRHVIEALIERVPCESELDNVQVLRPNTPHSTGSPLSQQGVSGDLESNKVINLSSHPNYQLVRPPQHEVPDDKLTAHSLDVIVGSTLPEQMRSTILDNDEIEGEMEGGAFTQRLYEILEAEIHPQLEGIDEDALEERQAELEERVDEMIELIEAIFPSHMIPGRLADLDLSADEKGIVHYLSDKDAKRLHFYHITNEQIDELLNFFGNLPQTFEGKEEDQKYNEVQLFVGNDGRCFAFHTNSVFMDHPDEKNLPIRPYFQDLGLPLSELENTTPLTHQPFQELKGVTDGHQNEK